jgi:hypothetical protein
MAMTEEVFGFSGASLEDAKKAVQDALGIVLIARESLYRGGEYFRTLSTSRTRDPGHRSMPDEEFILQRNCDIVDGEPNEPEHSDLPCVLYVSSTTRAADLKSKLANIVGCRHIRSRAV